MSSGNRLSVLGIIVGVVMAIASGSPYIILPSLIVVCFLSIYLLWDFHWVSKSLLRQLNSMALMILIYMGMGYAIWPDKQNPLPTAEEIAKEVVKRLPQQSENKTIIGTNSQTSQTTKESKETTRENKYSNKDTKPELMTPHQSASNEIRKQPDITLRFIYTKRPALVLVNNSDYLAREIKWAIGLWNHDGPSGLNPLPIPCQTFDWIKPHESSGPLNLFDSPRVAPLLKPGDKLYGSIGINCPDCPRGRTFFIFIEIENGGWYSEAIKEKSGGILIPKHFMQEEANAYYQQIIAIPEHLRIPIQDP